MLIEKPVLPFDITTPDLNRSPLSAPCRCLWQRWTPTGTTSLNWTRQEHIWSTSARNRMWSWSRTCCSACKAAGRSWCSGLLSAVVCWMMPGRGRNRYCIFYWVWSCFTAVGTFLLSLESSGNCIWSLFHILSAAYYRLFISVGPFL